MSLAIAEHEGTLVVDSRLIAQELGIEHRSLFRTVKKYQTELQQGFGVLRFEVTKPQLNTKGGRPEEFCYLTEPQATFLMTLSRNTPEVVACKLNLVEAFEKAKQVIKTVIPQQSEHIRELELQNAILEKQLALRHLDNNMLTMHGAELVLALRGKSDQIVKVETVVTEVVNPKTERCDRIVSSDQLKQIVKQNTGQSIKSMKWFVDEVKRLNRNDLLVAVTRHQTGEYVSADGLSEAIALVFNNNRQMVIGETHAH